MLHLFCLLWNWKRVQELGFQSRGQREKEDGAQSSVVLLNHVRNSWNWIVGKNCLHAFSCRSFCKAGLCLRHLPKEEKKIQKNGSVSPGCILNLGVIQPICSTLTGAHSCIKRLLVLFFNNTVCKSQWRIQKSWLNGLVSYVRSFWTGKFKLHNWLL